MKLVDCSRSELIEYVSRQLVHFFPDGAEDSRPMVAANLDESLDRLSPSVRLCRVWPEDSFSYLHSNQYAAFLYFVANTIWRNSGNERLCTKLFYLNKTLNGFECFFTIELPEILCISHSLGIVLAHAVYGNYLVLHQNSTVGRLHTDQRPVLGEGVVLFPNSAIVGNCNVGARTVLAQGSSIINADTPGDCVVFSNGGRLTFKKPKINYLTHFFRVSE
jgi:serine O-acetyltransferase